MISFITSEHIFDVSLVRPRVDSVVCICDAALRVAGGPGIQGQRINDPSVDDLMVIALQQKITCKRETQNIDALAQERRNSSVLAMELRLSCTNPSI